MGGYPWLDGQQWLEAAVQPALHEWTQSHKREVPVFFSWKVCDCVRIILWISISMIGFHQDPESNLPADATRFLPCSWGITDSAR